MDRRLGRKGLRPRDAAYLIGAFWAVAVVVFGVVERLIDPKTFHTVWLGMRWAIETVTTVGYGDIVPDQIAGKVIAALLMLGAHVDGHADQQGRPDRPLQRHPHGLPSVSDFEGVWQEDPLELPPADTGYNPIEPSGLETPQLTTVFRLRRGDCRDSG